LLPTVENRKCLVGFQWRKVHVRFVEEWSEDPNFEKEDTYTHTDNEAVL